MLAAPMSHSGGGTNLRLVDGQVRAVGPLETLFIEEGQVVLCRQVLSLNESAEQGLKMSLVQEMRW